jgi:hypothetical protein
MLLLFVVSGCFSLNTKLNGKITIHQKNLTGLRIITDKGGRQQFVDGEVIQLQILGKRKIVVKRSSDSDFWPVQMRASLKPFQKADSLYLTSKETGQRYDMNFLREQKLLSSKKEERFLECWFKQKTRSIASEDRIVEGEQMIKGRQKGLVQIDTYQEFINVDFYEAQTMSPSKEKKVASFTSDPIIIDKVKTLEIFEECE